MVVVLKEENSVRTFNFENNYIEILSNIGEGKQISSMLLNGENIVSFLGGEAANEFLNKMIKAYENGDKVFYID